MNIPQVILKLELGFAFSGTNSGGFFKVQGVFSVKCLIMQVAKPMR